MKQDEIIARAIPDDEWTPPKFRFVKTSTPWGRADCAYTYGRGIIRYCCPGHGGFHVSRTLHKQMHPAFQQNGNPWYEEDDDWAMVAVSFPERFPRSHVAHAFESLGRWHADELAEFLGEEV